MTAKKREPTKKAPEKKKFGPTRCGSTHGELQCKFDAGHEGMHESYPDSDEGGTSKSWV